MFKFDNSGVIEASAALFGRSGLVKNISANRVRAAENAAVESASNRITGIFVGGRLFCHCRALNFKAFRPSVVCQKVDVSPLIPNPFAQASKKSRISVAEYGVNPELDRVTMLLFAVADLNEGVKKCWNHSGPDTAGRTVALVPKNFCTASKNSSSCPT